MKFDLVIARTHRLPIGRWIPSPRHAGAQRQVVHLLRRANRFRKCRRHLAVNAFAASEVESARLIRLAPTSKQATLLHQFQLSGVPAIRAVLPRAEHPVFVCGECFIAWMRLEVCGYLCNLLGVFKAPALLVPEIDAIEPFPQVRDVHIEQLEVLGSVEIQVSMLEERAVSVFDLPAQLRISFISGAPGEIVWIGVVDWPEEKMEMLAMKSFSSRFKRKIRGFSPGWMEKVNSRARPPWSTWVAGV